MFLGGNWLEQTGHTGLVFPSPKTGGRMDNIDSAWKDVCSRADIRKIRLHDLRHTFATKLVRAGVDLVTIQELMGHEDIGTTAKYFHTSDERKAKAVSLLG